MITTAAVRRLDPLDLIHLQIALEYEIDPQGMLAPYPRSSKQAACILYQYAGGEVLFTQSALPAPIRAGLAQLSQRQRLFHDPAAVLTLLSQAGRCTQGPLCHSYYFVSLPTLEQAAGASQRAGRWEIMAEGRPVCWAWSVRENDRCAEVAVETDPAFRRRGYARRVTAAWARQIIGLEKIAFFSHREANLASRRLTDSLAVRYFSSSLSFEQ